MSAHVIGGLNCRNATLRNPTGPALVADGLRVDGDVLLGHEFVADGQGPRCTLRLLDARISGRIACTGAGVGSRSDPTHRWDVDGLTYRGMPQLDATGHHREAWLRLVREATPAYRAQPYQQLAAVCRGDGHDSEARAVLMQQRRDQLDRGALTRRGDRVWARLTGALLGFGYQPWRALLYLVGVLALSVGLALLGATVGALDRADDLPSAAATISATAPGNALRVPCTTMQIIGVGLDLGTPFLPSAGAGAGGCAITSAATGSLLTGIRWLLQLTAWGLAALFVAGFTGIVRKT